MGQGGKVDHRDDVDLGTCCACGKSGADVRNVMMLDRKGPTPGKGWGCLVCGLPLDGAVAVLCDGCLEAKAEIRFVCAGYPASDGRMPIEELPLEAFEHNLDLHRFEALSEADLRAMLAEVEEADLPEDQEFARAIRQELIRRWTEGRGGDV